MAKYGLKDILKKTGKYLGIGGFTWRLLKQLTRLIGSTGKISMMSPIGII
jgi:hypothetical protein